MKLKIVGRNGKELVAALEVGSAATVDSLAEAFAKQSKKSNIDGRFKS